MFKVERNELRYQRHHDKFQRTFGVPLACFWDELNGFVGVEFIQWLDAPAGVDVADYVKERFGEDALGVLYNVMS